MANTSGYHPCGYRILVLPESKSQLQKEVERAGLVMPEKQAGEHRRAHYAGIVVAVGDTAWKDPRLGEKPWAKVGDRVMFGKTAGFLFKGVDGKEYKMMNDEDIICRLDDQVELAEVD